MKKTYNEFGDFAPRNGSTKIKTDALLITGIVMTIAICWVAYVFISLIEII